MGGGALLSISVRADIKEVTRYLDRMEKRQVPFATARAITDTAFDVRKRIVHRTFPRAFDVKNMRFPSVAFRVIKASKVRPRASVHDHLGRANLDLHTTGGIKRPKGKHIAVPTEKVRRGRRGVVKSQRPAAILEKPDVFKVERSGRGAAGIYRRQRRGKVVRLYTLASQVKIDRRFRFYEDAARTAARAFRHRFDKAMAHALRTAR